MQSNFVLRHEYFTCLHDDSRDVLAGDGVAAAVGGVNGAPVGVELHDGAVGEFAAS